MGNFTKIFAYNTGLKTSNNYNFLKNNYLFFTDFLMRNVDLIVETNVIVNYTMS